MSANILTQPGCDVAKPVVAHKKNFETLKAAFRRGDVALMECRFNATDERVAVICAVGKDGDEIAFTPFAVMLNGNPYEMLSPPDPDGGFRDA